MAKLKKRNDGYYCKTFMYNGKRYSVYATDKQELDKKAVEKLEELKLSKQNHDNPTIEAFYLKWVDNRRGSVKEATIRSQNCHYNTISVIMVGAKQFKDYRLSEVKAEDIRTIQRALLDANNSTQTVNDKISFISHLFHDAVTERYCDYNPCTAVKTLKRTEEKARDGKHRALTEEETAKFFEAAQDSFYLNVFKMCLFTGMRVGEVGALYYSDIYDGTIHIRRTITRLESGSYAIGDDGKTKDSIRNIPMNEKIIEVIEKQKELNRILDGDKVISIHETLFRAVERGLLLSTPVDREIRRICKRAGIEPFSCHAFRDTFATRAIENGVEPRTLQELLGHKDYSITMNLYGHVLDGTKSTAMNKIIIAI